MAIGTAASWGRNGESRTTTRQRLHRGADIQLAGPILAGTGKQRQRWGTGEGHAHITRSAYGRRADIHGALTRTASANHMCDIHAIQARTGLLCARHMHRVHLTRTHPATTDSESTRALHYHDRTKPQPAHNCTVRRSKSASTHGDCKAALQHMPSLHYMPMQHDSISTGLSRHDITTF